MDWLSDVLVRLEAAGYEVTTCCNADGVTVYTVTRGGITYAQSVHPFYLLRIPIG